MVARTLGPIACATQHLKARRIVVLFEPTIQSKSAPVVGFSAACSPIAVDVVDGQTLYQCLPTTYTLGAAVGVEGGEFYAVPVGILSSQVFFPVGGIIGDIIGSAFFAVTGIVSNIVTCSA
jgi:hypothetical protein